MAKKSIEGSSSDKLSKLEAELRFLQSPAAADKFRKDAIKEDASLISVTDWLPRPTPEERAAQKLQSEMRRVSQSLATARSELAVASMSDKKARDGLRKCRASIEEARASLNAAQVAQFNATTQRGRNAAVETIRSETARIRELGEIKELYEERLRRSEPIAPQQGSDFWRQLSLDFTALQQERDSMGKDDGLFCQSPELPSDEWEHFSGSHSRTEISRVKTLAERGAIGLGFRGNTSEAVTYWMALLRHRVPGFRADNEREKAHGHMTRVAENSAVMCEQLFNEALAVIPIVGVPVRSSRSSANRKAKTHKSAVMEKITPKITSLWRKHRNASHKEILALADKEGYTVPWDDCHSWNHAYSRHESAVKTFLSKAKTKIEG